MSQSITAKAVGVTVPTVKRWERGVLHPDKLHLSRLASFFELDVVETIGLQRLAAGLPEDSDSRIPESSLAYHQFTPTQPSRSALQGHPGPAGTPGPPPAPPAQFYGYQA